jgi:hypothetical protein
VDDVCNWLSDHGLNQFATIFRSNSIAGKHLLTLTNHELMKDLAVTSLGHRKDILSQIDNLRNSSCQRQQEIAKGAFGAVYECNWKGKKW